MTQNAETSKNAEKKKEREEEEEMEMQLKSTQATQDQAAPDPGRSATQIAA